MSAKRYLTLKLALKDKNEGAVGCVVHIKDKYALARFSNRKVGRKVYMAQKRLGKDVRYMERVNGFAESFPDKTKEEIVEILKKQLTEGGDFDEVK